MVEIPRVIIPPLEPGDGVPGGYQPVPTSRPMGGAVGVLWAPFIHQHVIDDVTGLQSALDALGAEVTDWGDLTGVPSTFPPSVHTHPQSEVTNLVSDLALKAPLASPVFTGNPQAPTPSPGDNDTSIATTAFVTAAVAAGGGGISEAPINGLAYGRMDADWAQVPDMVAHTLKANLASPTFTGIVTVDGLLITRASSGPSGPGFRLPHGAAPNTPTNGDFWTTTAGVFARINGATVGPLGTGGAATAATTTFTPAAGIAATDVQAAIQEVVADVAAVYAPLASPIFTGNPTAPTPLTADNDTSVATTAFVKAQGYLSDAPNDGAMYARMDGSWQEAVPNEPGQWLLNGEYNITTYATQKKAQAVNASASTTISRLSGDYVDLTLDINITTLTLSGWPASGTMGQIHLAINFTGAFTITWPAAVKWPGGTAPTLTGVNGKADHIMLVSDNGGTTIWGFVMGQNYDA